MQFKSMNGIGKMHAVARMMSLPRRPWILFAAATFVFLTPNVDLAPDLQWHDGQRLAQLALLAVVLLTLAAPGAAHRMTDTWHCLSPRIRAALAAAFTAGLVSCYLAPLPRWALLEWGMLWLLLMLVLGVAAERHRLGKDLDQVLVLLFLATATAYAVTACVIYVAMFLVGPEYGQTFDLRQLYTGFSNIRFFGVLQTMLLPFLLLPAMWWGTTRLSRYLLWSVPVVWWMLVIGSGTRGTWVALLIGVCTAWWFGGHAGRRWIRLQSGGLLGGLLCYALFIQMVPWLIAQPAAFFYRTGDLVSLSLRGVLWSTAADYAIQHPLFGVGPMHYAYFATEVAAHPHNAVLQWLTEWGVPAALLFTAVSAVAGLAFAGWVRRTAEAAGERQALFRVALLAALAGAAAQAMVDGVLVMPVSQTLLALLCGWAVGMYCMDRNRPRCNVMEHAAVLVVTLFAAAVVAYGVAPEIGNIAEREQAYLKTSPPNIPLLPRFWAQGWINR